MNRMVVGRRGRQSSPSEDGTTLPWYASLRPVFEPGHQIALLQNGTEFFAALETSIDQAHRSVHLETYIFGEDASATRIAAALARAAHRGLQVRLLVDGYGTPQLRGEVATLLNSAAVAVRSFRPLGAAGFIQRQRLRRMHRKLALIDGERAFVGGINILDDYIDPNHGFRAHTIGAGGAKGMTNSRVRSRSSTSSRVRSRGGMNNWGYSRDSTCSLVCWPRHQRQPQRIAVAMHRRTGSSRRWQYGTIFVIAEALSAPISEQSARRDARS
jgi:phosphatidylserine/phosphatidylglycerophosphate/cardiolipin synthase-like enzyme